MTVRLFFACLLLDAPVVCATRGHYTITIEYAENVPNYDNPWDKSDLFVRIDGPSGSECGRTSTKWDNHNPQWYETISCGCVDSGATLTATVYDEDNYNWNDEIGYWNPEAGYNWIGSHSISGMTIHVSESWDTGACTSSSYGGTGTSYGGTGTGTGTSIKSPPPSPPPPPSKITCSLSVCSCTCAATISTDQYQSCDALSSAAQDAINTYVALYSFVSSTDICNYVDAAIGNDCSQAVPYISELGITATCSSTSSSLSIGLIVGVVAGVLVVIVVVCCVLKRRKKAKTAAARTAPVGKDMAMTDVMTHKSTAVHSAAAADAIPAVPATTSTRASADLKVDEY